MDLLPEGNESFTEVRWQMLPTRAHFRFFMFKHVFILPLGTHLALRCNVPQKECRKSIAKAA
jgi:hypothetical protein